MTLLEVTFSYGLPPDERVLASTVRPRELNEADRSQLWRRGRSCQPSPI
jgi:hypothetical protein